MAHKPNKQERLARAARLNEPPRPEAKPRSWTLLFFRNALLWAVPVALLWTALTPFYNRFLLGSAQNLVRLTESPNVTDLLRQGDHFAYISRRDFPPSRTLVHSFRVTDVHFHLVLLLALFLAVPRVPWRERLGNLGWALLVTVFFDVFVVFSKVKVAYATQLGTWSLEHYGPFALWAAFYLPLLLGSRETPVAQGRTRPAG